MKAANLAAVPDALSISVLGRDKVLRLSHEAMEALTVAAGHATDVPMTSRATSTGITAAEIPATRNANFMILLLGCCRPDQRRPAHLSHQLSRQSSVESGVESRSPYIRRSDSDVYRSLRHKHICIFSER